MGKMYVYIWRWGERENELGDNNSKTIRKGDGCKRGRGRAGEREEGHVERERERDRQTDRDISACVNMKMEREGERESGLSGNAYMLLKIELGGQKQEKKQNERQYNSKCNVSAWHRVSARLPAADVLLALPPLVPLLLVLLH